MNKIRIIFVVSLSALILQSCDENHCIGLKNNSSSEITVITINHEWKDNAKEVTSVLPGSYKLFNMTVMSLDTLDLFFDQLQIIKNRDTLTINGRKKIFNMFVKDGHAYFIIIGDKTDFHKR